MERIVVTHTGHVIHSKELPAELTRKEGTQRTLPRSLPCTLPRSLAEAVEGCERETIHLALQACDLHRERTAKPLGVSIRTLHYKMGRYGLH